MNVEFLIVVLLIFSTNLFSQKNTVSYIEYHNLVNEAEFLLYERKDLKVASRILKKAFKLVPNAYPKDIYNLSKCMALRKKRRSAVRYLKKINQNNFRVLSHYLLDRDSVIFSSVKQKKSFRIFYNNLKVSHQNQATEDLQSIIDTVKYFVNQDQSFRSITKFASYDDDNWWLEFENSEYGKFHKKFVKYVIDNGYPGYLKIGGQSEFLQGLLVHLSEKQTNILYPILLRELEKGNVSPSTMSIFLGVMEHDYNNNPCQYYIRLRGDHIRCDMNEANWKEVFKNRLSIGESIYYINSFNSLKPEWKFEKIPFVK